jgi:hypothetical protein
MRYAKAPNNVRADWTIYPGLNSNEPVADVYGTEDHARLLAQAPAMLKALQRLTHPMADDDDLAHALDVIARATGQPVPDDDEGPEPPYAGYESEAQLRRMAEVRRLEALRAKGLIP